MVLSKLCSVVGFIQKFSLPYRFRIDFHVYPPLVWTSSTYFQCMFITKHQWHNFFPSETGLLLSNSYKCGEYSKLRVLPNLRTSTFSIFLLVNHLDLPILLIITSFVLIFYMFTFISNSWIICSWCYFLCGHRNTSFSKILLFQFEDLSDIFKWYIVKIYQNFLQYQTVSHFFPKLFTDVFLLLLNVHLSWKLLERLSFELFSSINIKWNKNLDIWDTFLLPSFSHFKHIFDTVTDVDHCQDENLVRNGFSKSKTE